jgi:hypothetical protein
MMLIFDSSPTIYWTVGYVLTVGVIGLNLIKKIPLPLYLLGAFGVFVLMRLPSIVLNRELNADESQMISHAITLFQDPVYWRSVDGTTIGPLDNYLLVLPRLLGFPLDYVSARVMGLLCGVGTLFFFLVAIKRWFGGATARITLLIPLLFLAFTQETDYIHYSSEQVPLLLLSICLALLAGLSKRKKEFTFLVKKAPVWKSYGLGLVAGMVPFAKLQAVPQVLWLVVGGLYLTYHYYRKNQNSKLLVALLVGGVTFPALALVWMLFYGVFQDFVNFYILGNAVYAGGATLAEIPSQFGKLVLLSPDFTALLIIVAVMMIVGLVAGQNSPSKPALSNNLFVPLIIFGYGLTAVYAATKSGNSFVHYLNFCIYPLGLTAALGIQKVRHNRPLALAGPLLLIGWFGLQDALSFHRTRQLNALVSVDATTLPESPVVKALKPYVTPADRMVVWGWQCRYYVEAQLAQGTAENHSERCIFQHPLQAEYRQRYLRDMKRTRPVVFIDAVGKNSTWVQDVATQGYESFPELAAYIRNNYTYLGKIDDTRLFIRKDRLSSKTN